MKIYVKDTLNGSIHQVGTDRHDSLVLIDGGLFYYNLQNGEGTYGGGYLFCTEDGNTDFNNEEYDNYYHIGFTEEKFKKQYEKNMGKLLEVKHNEKD